MQQLSGTNREKTALIKPDIYREFILWTAMPHPEKVKLGLETQGAFCEHYNIGKNTPGAWKMRPDFESRVDALLKMWSTDKHPDVVHAIYRSAIKGNPMSQMLWLQYFKRFNPKADAEADRKKVEISENDIRHLIEILPEPLKSKHYANLRDLLDDASSVANARVAEDDRWTEKPQEPVLDEADNDAQNVPEPEAYALAESDSCGIRGNLESSVVSFHNKSSARWG